jgi:hypothetical protein
MEAVGDMRLALKKTGIKLNTAAAVDWRNDGSVSVNLEGSDESDLGFVHGKPVSRISIGSTKVRDLEPLRGLPLKYFFANKTPLTDIEPLRGLPLIDVRLDETQITSVAPLAECPSLETVVLPPNARDVEALRRLPKLRRISYEAEAGTGLPAGTAEQFWKEFDARRKGGGK